MQSFRSVRNPFSHWRPTGGYQNVLRIHLRLIQAASHLHWNHVLHPWGSRIISQRAKTSTGFTDASSKTMWGGKGSELFLPSVCDLLRKMVLARGWSEGLYSMGRSGSRSNRINPLRIDLKPKWMATDTTNSSQQNVLSTGVTTLWWRWGLNALKQSKTVFWQPEKLI